MDRSAAFDTIDYNILIDDLENCFGLKDTTLKWAKSYLQNHKFKLNIRNKYSIPREIRTFLFHKAVVPVPSSVLCMQAQWKMKFHQKESFMDMLMIME